MSMLKSIKEAAVVKKALRGILNESGEPVKGCCNIAARVSGNKFKEGLGHCFTSGLSNISRGGTFDPGSV